MIAFETAGSGPRLVLVHGVGVDRSIWRRCVPLLAGGFEVVLPDLRGHGGSPPIRGGVTLEQLAGDLLDTVLAEPAHVVGYSLGALVAQQVAVTRPDAVLTLSLVSSVANRSPAQRAAVQRRLGNATRDFEPALRATARRWLAHLEEGDPLRALEDELVTTLLANDRTSYLSAYELFGVADAEVWPRLAEIAAPTLVVTGGEDPNATPAMADVLAETIPDARAVVLDGCGHLVPLERPEALAHELARHVLAANAGAVSARG